MFSNLYFGHWKCMNEHTSVVNERILLYNQIDSPYQLCKTAVSKRGQHQAQAHIYSITFYEKDLECVTKRSDTPTLQRYKRETEWKETQIKVQHMKMKTICTVHVCMQMKFSGLISGAKFALTKRHSIQSVCAVFQVNTWKSISLSRLFTNFDDRIFVCFVIFVFGHHHRE